MDLESRKKGRKNERSFVARETKGKEISLSRIPQFRLITGARYEQSDGATDENSEGQFKNVKSFETRRVAANKIKRMLARK